MACMALSTPVSAASGSSSDIVLNVSQDKYLLGPNVDVLRDASGQMSIDEVASSINLQGFRHDGRDHPNFGFTHAAYWFRFTITNHSKTPLWYLDATREWVEHVDMYNSDVSGWNIVHAGTDRPYSTRLVANERPILPLIIEPGHTATYYLRLQSSGSLALIGHIVKPDVFEIENDFFSFQYGAYYGALLIMAIYNFFLFLSIRDRSYGYLSLLLAGVLGMELGAHGHAFRYLDIPMTSTPMTIAMGLIGMAFVLLTRYFLRSSIHLPRLDRALLVSGILSVATGLLALFSDYAQVIGWMVLVPLATFCLIAALLRWRQGFSPAAYFFWAMGSFIMPGQIVVAQYFGLLPPSIMTEYGAHMGVIAMACLFSFGLADQIRRLHRIADKFVPKQMVQQLGRQTLAEVQLGDAADLEVTVLFSDIRSFTTISENLSPKECFEFINSYLALASPCIQASGGIIDKYIGDGIMAIFPGEAECALAGSDGLMKVTRQFNLMFSERYPEVRIGIGLHRGHVRLGILGDAQRMNATAISDTVNTASRLELLTKEYSTSVLASGDFVNALEPDARQRFQALGEIKVRGKNNMLTVYSMRC